MRTEEQSIAIHQALRLLGNSAGISKAPNYHNITEQIHGAMRVVNRLGHYHDDIDLIWSAALSLKSDQAVSDFRLRYQRDL